MPQSAPPDGSTLPDMTGVPRFRPSYITTSRTGHVACCQNRTMAKATDSSCPRSVHMRGGASSGLAGGKVLGGRLSAKGSVGTMSIVSVLEGLDEGIQLIETVRQVVDGIELVAPGAVAALHCAVDLGALGRQHEELDGLFWQASSNWAMNSEPPSTWMASTLKGMSREACRGTWRPRPRWPGCRPWRRSTWRPDRRR